MFENLLLLLGIITFALQMGSFFLGLYFFLSRRELWKFKGILFLGYLVMLYLFSLMRYYLGNLVPLELPLPLMIIRALEMTGISLLIYYFSATINYFMRRSWRLNRLIWVLLAVASTFALGVVFIFSGFSPWIRLPLTLLLMLSMITISLDALRSLPLIQREIDRTSISLLLGWTLLFIPLSLTTRFLQIYLEDGPLSANLDFLILSLFYLGMAVILIRYFIKRSLEGEERILTLSEQPKSFFEALSITPREKDIVILLEQGLSYKEIGAELDISINTVNNHIANIYKKFSVRSKVELLNALREHQR